MLDRKQVVTKFASMLVGGYPNHIQKNKNRYIYIKLCMGAEELKDILAEQDLWVRV